MQETPSAWTKSTAMRRARISGTLCLLWVLALPFLTMVGTGHEWMDDGLTDHQKELGAIAGIGGLVCFVTGFIARSQCWKRAWQAEVILPKGYFYGVVFWQLGIAMAMVCVAIFCLIMAHPAPVMAALPVGFALLLIGWPNGTPMEPHQP